MTALEKTWVEKLPATPFSDLVDIQIRTFDQIGKMPRQPFFTCSEYDKALRVLIKRSKVKIAQARVCYDAIMAKAKLDLLEKRHNNFRKGITRIVVRGLLDSMYIGAGYLNGQKVIVPARAWSGDIDWESQTLVCAGQKYTHLTVILRGALDADIRRLVSEYANGNADASRKIKKSHGRPGSKDYVVTEFERRIATGEKHVVLADEARLLAEWFRRAHPDKRPVKEKTICNTIRARFREIR